MIGWSDLDAERTLAQSIAADAGARMNTPGGQAPDALERVGMTGRDGAGVFIAYLRGTNPFDSRMAVWRFGAANPMVLSPQGRPLPGCHPRARRAPVGLLGATAVQQRRIFAARSNEAATQFGAAVKLKPPAGRPSVFSLEGEGTAPGGMLDLVALAAAGSDIANYHQRVRPGITLLAKALGDGEVRFTTRDAGDPLATTIAFAGKTAQTGSDGKVVISAEPDKKFKATATKNGYHPRRAA